MTVFLRSRIWRKLWTTWTKPWTPSLYSLICGYQTHQVVAERPAQHQVLHSTLTHPRLCLTMGLGVACWHLTAGGKFCMVLLNQSAGEFYSFSSVLEYEFILLFKRFRYQHALNNFDLVQRFKWISNLCKYVDYLIYFLWIWNLKTYRHTGWFK